MCKLTTFLLFGSLSCVAQAGHQFISFQVPDAGTQGTQAFAINSQGDIAGTYYTATGTTNGFIRHTDGSFVTFSLPSSKNVLVRSLNDAGTVVGTNGIYDYPPIAYLRSPDGNIVTFAAPNADSGSTYPTGLSASGAVCGFYIPLSDPGGESAFIRDPNGNYTEFTGNYDVTEPAAINSSGIVAGVTNSAGGDSAAYEGFLRHSSGRLEYFQAPGANGEEGTTPTALNDSGEVAGYYQSFSLNAGDNLHGFVRGKGGTIASFDGPYVADGPYETKPVAINEAGAVVGTFSSHYYESGFIRKPNGALVVLNYPGASQTVPNSINASGEVSGYYADSLGHYSGFLFTP